MFKYEIRGSIHESTLTHTAQCLPEKLFPFIYHQWYVKMFTFDFFSRDAAKLFLEFCAWLLLHEDLQTSSWKKCASVTVSMSQTLPEPRWSSFSFNMACQSSDIQVYETNWSCSSKEMIMVNMDYSRRGGRQDEKQKLVMQKQLTLLHQTLTKLLTHSFLSLPNSSCN